MELISIFCIVVPAVTAAVYILYINGFMFFESKTALTFRGIQKKGCFGAKFKKCNGITKKVINVKEERQFIYSATLEKGSIYAVVTARDKSGEYCFDDFNRTLTIPAGRYTITTYFDSASGSYTITW